MWVAGREMRIAGREMRIAGREMRVAGSDMQVAGRELRLPNVEGLGNSHAYAMAYPWRTFVTPLSLVVLTLYLAWCLFRIIDISHIPHCCGN